MSALTLQEVMRKANAVGRLPAAKKPSAGYAVRKVLKLTDGDDELWLNDVATRPPKPPRARSKHVRSQALPAGGIGIGVLRCLMNGPLTVLEAAALAGVSAKEAGSALSTIKFKKFAVARSSAQGRSLVYAITQQGRDALEGDGK